MDRVFSRIAGAGFVLALAGVAFAGGEVQGSTEGGVELTAPAPAGIPYYEYFNYSAYVRRSYVPGYTPHPTSLFENPRDYPWALCVLATPYYQYAGINGWFFGSPQGYQSSVPKGSHASKYYRGELGITKDLRGGYPQGMRVIEPAIVPVSNSMEKGGIFIQGASSQTALIGQEVETEAAPPAPVPMPAPTPASLEK